MTAMTGDRLAEIKEAVARRSVQHHRIPVQLARELLDEVDRLTAENSRLKDNLAPYRSASTNDQPIAQYDNEGRLIRAADTD